jgi:hypothetical protein
LKNTTLIISESQLLTSRIETLFSKQSWPAETVSTRLIIGQGSASMMDYRCVIFVIDDSFRKHFSGLINEMSAIIKNASAYIPIYLLFEHDDDTVFLTWLTHVKKTFKSAFSLSGLDDAIQNIVLTESCVPLEPIFPLIKAYS